MNDLLFAINPANPDPLFMSEFIDVEVIVIEKMGDAQSPSFEVEFTPEEAELAGAFREDALSEADASESATDGSQVDTAPAPAVP